MTNSTDAQKMATLTSALLRLAADTRREHRQMRQRVSRHG